MRIFPVITCLISLSVYGQHSPEDLSKVRTARSPVNLAKILLEGVNAGELELLKFQDFNGDPEIIQVSDIRIYDGPPGDPWYDDMLYFRDDMVEYEGIGYESLIDENKGNTPGQSEQWKIIEEIWSDIDNANSFLIEESGSTTPEFLHLYYRIAGDDQSQPKYLASFNAKKAVDYLNNSGLIWYQTNDYGHLAGSVFLDPSNELMLEAAKRSGITLTGEDLSFERRIDRWWSTYRNFSLGENDHFQFLYADDSLMWKLPVKDFTDSPDPDHPTVLLLGDALASGAVFVTEDNISINPDHSGKIERIQTIITEQFLPLDSLFLIENSGRVKMPVSGSGIGRNEWEKFVNVIIEGGKNGNWTPYRSEHLEIEMTKNDLDLRMMIYEQQAIELQYDYDQWNKNVTYYFEDRIEYAGILYESLKENNEDRVPVQWPEYWKKVVVNTDYFYPDELRRIKVRSKLDFDPSGNNISIEPEAFCFEVPGNLVPSGFNKEIAWFEVNEISIESDPAASKILTMIRSHDFLAEMLSYSPLKVSKQ